jgi:hypothetical protein
MRPARSLLALVLLLVFALRAASDDDELTSEIWLHPQKAGAVSAAQLVAVRDPLAMAAMRVEGFDRDLWDEPPLWLDMVPPLSRDRLDKVKDDTSFGNFGDRAPAEIPKEALAEDMVFWQAVAYSAKVPRDIFATAARANSKLTFGHLYHEPGKYRGKVVHIEGRLKQLKRLDPPWHAQRKGIGVLYEGWIYLDQPGTHPVCVLFPIKPDSLAIGDKLNERVSFDGYFFKRYRYISGRLDEDKNNVALNTLALIGPTVTPVGHTSTAGWSMYGSSTILTWILGFVGGVVLLIMSMTWWFKRNDRLVRARLEAVQAGRLTAMADTLEQLPRRAEDVSPPCPQTPALPNTEGPRPARRAF